ncbi:hypothetical protein CLF_105881 [Clonorchis sinensis]|uniref:Uncharacterized protein n=1 Tax=Clonorchis sinensis TaxID=79923 RepID=G7YPH7_CLOSI|nr:hypothetical protein CLF_105881 [Clonorchis sinensis]
MTKAMLALFSLVCWILILSNNILTVRAACVCLPSLQPCTVNADCGGGTAVCASTCASSACICFADNSPCNNSIPCITPNLCYSPCPAVTTTVTTTTATTTIATTTGFPDFLLAKLLLILDLLYVATWLLAIFVLLAVAIVAAFYLLNFT